MRPQDIFDLEMNIPQRGRGDSPRTDSLSSIPENLRPVFERIGTLRKAGAAHEKDRGHWQTVEQITATLTAWGTVIAASVKNSNAQFAMNVVNVATTFIPVVEDVVTAVEKGTFDHPIKTGAQTIALLTSGGQVVSSRILGELATTTTTLGIATVAFKTIADMADEKDHALAKTVQGLREWLTPPDKGRSSDGRIAAAATIAARSATGADSDRGNVGAGTARAAGAYQSRGQRTGARQTGQQRRRSV